MNCLLKLLQLQLFFFFRLAPPFPLHSPQNPIPIPYPSSSVVFHENTPKFKNFISNTDPIQNTFWTGVWEGTGCEVVLNKFVTETILKFIDIMEQDNIDHLLKEKESEVRELHILKVKSLENKLVEKDNLISLLDLKNRELQKDFEYNLSIIQDRDSDIKELTENMFKLKDILEEKQKETDELQV